MLLHQPTSLAAHLLYADTLYTLGGPANWRTARSYYSGGPLALERCSGVWLSWRSPGCCPLRPPALATGPCADASYARPAAVSAGVIEMSEGRNLRALYGVCACAAQLGGVKGRESREDDDAGLPGLAAEALLQRYAEGAPDKLPLVRAMLKVQGLLPR